LKELLALAQLPRATFYDRLHRKNKPDKYAALKVFIKKTFHDSYETYGYRRIHIMARKACFKCSPNTILRLMGQLNLSVTLYSRHTSGYHSYKGKVGTVNDNLLHQQFDAEEPFTVLHTDITQVRLLDNSWGYISAIIDEASREVITVIVRNSANKEQLHLTLDDLAKKLPTGVTPIVHSDQGWQYQTREYQSRVHAMGIIPSMSRKGNCHDNAPMESFFNLLKRERLNRQPIKDLEELKQIVNRYVTWFNHDRISLNKNGLTPIEYRNQAAV
jgi:putative transposase